MNWSFPASALLATSVLLGGCEAGDGIDQGGKVFADISADAQITLTGTEPFWGLEIDAAEGKEHPARFSQPGDIDGRAFTLSRFAGNNGLGFSGELAGRKMQVAITPGDCSDGMSDRRYPFAATVAWGDETLLGCAHTSNAPFTGPAEP